jgi:hypothetical protein
MSSSPDDATPPTTAGTAEPAVPATPAAPETAGEPAAAAPAAADSSPAEGPEQAPAPAAPAPAPRPAEPPAPSDDQREPLPSRVLLNTVFGLLVIGVALWLVLAWSGYKEKYSQQTEGWRLGSTKMLEITLIRDDKKNLACASDRRFGEIHCGYTRAGKPNGPQPADDPHILQPYNTVKNELFLAAGLWQAPVLKEPLPTERFTVVCNYHVVGVLKAVALRWSPTGSFNPVDQSVAVGSLSDCVIPQ